MPFGPALLISVALGGVVAPAAGGVLARVGSAAAGAPPAAGSSSSASGSVTADIPRAWPALTPARNPLGLAAGEGGGCTIPPAVVAPAGVTGAPPAAGAAGSSPAPPTVALPAWNPFFTAEPRPATPPATAPTPLANVPTPLPTAVPILFKIGPSSS